MAIKYYENENMNKERRENTQKTVDNSYSPRYNEDRKATTYDVNYAWKKSNEKALRYAGDSAIESVDKGLKEASKFMKDAPKGTDYGKVQSASVKWRLANDANNKELQQSAFNELTGHLSAENKEPYLKKARPLQEFVDAKDTFDYKHNNYTTTKNANKEFSVTTYDLQQFLNKEGWKDKFGNSLKEDGLYGAKTEYAHDQMLAAEDAKNSNTESTVQPTQTVAPAQTFEPTPVQSATPTTTQPAETNNRTREGMEKYHNVEIASRGGTSVRFDYLNKPGIKVEENTNFADVKINYNNVVSIAEDIVSEKTVKDDAFLSGMPQGAYSFKMYGLATAKMPKFQMVDFVKKIAKDLALPEDLALAVVQTESSFEHWKKDGTLNVNAGGDHGLMQINISSHPDAFKSKTMDIKNNWQHNAVYGLTYLKMCYATALKSGYKGDELLKATYSMYNSGRCYTYEDPTAAGHEDVKKHVSGFWRVYTNREWE